MAQDTGKSVKKFRPPDFQLILQAAALLLLLFAYLFAPTQLYVQVDSICRNFF